MAAFYALIFIGTYILHFLIIIVLFSVSEAFSAFSEKSSLKVTMSRLVGTEALFMTEKSCAPE